MSHNFERERVFALAGTVAIPSTFPEPGIISIEPGGRSVRVVQRTGPRIVLARIVHIRDIRALFISFGEECNFENGYWLFNCKPRQYSKAIQDGAKSIAKKTGKEATDPASIPGIIYVPENAPTVLEVQAGLTAAECAEYYPPTPFERMHGAACHKC